MQPTLHPSMTTPWGVPPELSRFLAGLDDLEYVPHQDELPILPGVESLAVDKSDADAVITSRKPLRDEIEKLISSYRSSSPLEKPPVSPQELVIMAIICSNQPCLTVKDIMMWISAAFPFYLSKMAETCAEHMQRNFQAGNTMAYTPPPGVFEVADALRAYEVPLGEIGDEDGTCYWTTTPPQARIFLRRWLEPERKGVFPFMDLPKKIRRRIYKEVMVAPLPGLDMIDPRWAHVFGRIGDTRTNMSTSSWKDIGRVWGFTRYERISKTLQLLLVSKAVYKEAMPIFYECNSFRFGWQGCLTSLLNDLSADRLRHLRSIHIDWCRKYGEHFSELVVPSEIDLDTFSVGICDQNFPQVLGEYKHYLFVPGMGIAVALARSARLVEIHAVPVCGTCDKFEDFLEEATNR